jgi:prepilin-type N-terminal cleavage/methylation domain-containing protein
MIMPGQRRGAFTAIEMIVVLSIMVVLSSMTVPALLPSIKRGRVNEGASLILEVASQARALAQANAAGGGRYGVLISEAPQGTWVALTKGGTELGSASDRRWLNSGVVVTMPSTSCSWEYENVNGMLAAASRPYVNVTVRSRDATLLGRYRKAVAVYYLGYSHSEEP